MARRLELLGVAPLKAEEWQRVPRKVLLEMLGMWEGKFGLPEWPVAIMTCKGWKVRVEVLPSECVREMVTSHLCVVGE